jgi:polyisoprenoid-binding protein YceI
MLKRFSVLAFSLTILISTAGAQTSTWVPDKAHCEVDFSVLHMSLSNVHGRFGNIGGAVVLDESDLARSSVDVTIDLNSVDTGVGARDSVLKSSSFFDVDQFPTATFVSTSVAKTSGGLTVNGNLTLHGVTKAVVLWVEGPNGPIMSMDHKPHSGFSATGSISRSAFGIASGYPTAVVGDDIKLTIDLDVIKQ